MSKKVQDGTYGYTNYHRVTQYYHRVTQFFMGLCNFSTMLRGLSYVMPNAFFKSTYDTPILEFH